MFIQRKTCRALNKLLMAITLLLFSCGVMWAQEINVSGTVTDKSGEPLIGVYVLIQGTKTGTTTDIDGKYSINAPSNGVLEYSSMGYQAKKEAINGRSLINVVL